MGVGHWLIVGWAVLSCVLWTVLYMGAVRGLFTLRALWEVNPKQPERWPTLSVVVPACNEANTLRAALATLIAQDYPHLEIVLVNDRSTDDTGQLIDELAASDARITAVHVHELPDGWLGKVHALDEGYKHASGEWLLFSDADVHFAPGLLEKAMALAIERKLDHLPLVPELRAGSFWHEVAVDAFGLMFFQSVRAHALADPESDAYVGAGAFNLVRRASFEQSEGFPWLRMEVADDVGLGLALHRAGARAELWLATRELSVLWYPSLPAMVRGLEKNMYAVVGHFNPAFATARLLGFVVVVLGPFAGAFVSPWFMLVLLNVPIISFAMQRRLHQRLAPGLFTPVGIVLIAFMVAWSGYKCLRQRGIVWRGTRYPLDELRQLQQVKL